jgi:hypothetical protein
MKNKDIVKINLEDEKENDKKSFKKAFKELPEKNIARKKVPKFKISKSYKKNDSQKKKIKELPLFISSSSDNFSAEELLNEINLEEENNIETAENLINQAEELIKEERLKEIPDIEPKFNIQKEVKKEVILNNKEDFNESLSIQDMNLGYNLFDLKKCPLCSGKMKRSKVIKRNNILSQMIKCKNKNCNFEKEIMIVL